ncbi:hypothetical protein BC835DRAFT_1414026 [Cytidiella melzeri]|nr:hypothetical protein BC835DRAFT_1414026 [Cytidiella melzeri]
MRFSIYLVLFSAVVTGVFHMVTASPVPYGSRQSLYPTVSNSERQSTDNFRDPRLSHHQVELTKRGLRSLLSSLQPNAKMPATVAEAEAILAKLSDDSIFDLYLNTKYRMLTNTWRARGASPEDMAMLKLLKEDPNRPITSPASKDPEPAW